MNTLQKLSYTKVGVAIFLQIYGVSNYLPHLHTPTPVVVQQTVNEKDIELDAATGFLRVKWEMAHLLCQKHERSSYDNSEIYTEGCPGQRHSVRAPAATRSLD